MDQKIVPLTADFIEHNEKQRAWVKGHFTEDAEAKYASLENKLRLLDVIVRQRWIEPTETWKLQALGITLGDALVQGIGLVLVTVDDEFGHGPAVAFPGTTILAFPLTAISKRIERNEEVDIHELVDGVSQTLREMQAAGYT